MLAVTLDMCGPSWLFRLVCVLGFMAVVIAVTVTGSNQNDKIDKKTLDG